MDAAAGGTAITNVLANDLINADMPDPSTFVTLTEVAGTNTSPAGFPITLNTATGAVDVPANTPPGTYSLKYQFCQVSDAANCATATATVQVLGPPPVAVALTQPVDSHLVGATHQAQALVTDAAGQPVANADVTLTVVSGPNKGTTMVVKSDNNGVVPFTYTSNGGVGSDVIQATVATNGDPLVSNSLTVIWKALPVEPPVQAAPTPVPTLSFWALFMTALTAAGLGWRRLRHQDE